MDFTRLNEGEKIAGVSGILLFGVMVIFNWFGVEASGRVGGFALSFSGESRNAFGSYGFIDIVLLITCIAAVGLALLAASKGDIALPVAASAIVAGLGILSVVLIVISIISPPSFLDVSGGGIDFDYTRKVGVWLGLIASAAVTVGGYLAMQAHATSVGAQAEHWRGEVPGERPDAGPPPPPSSP
jgi:hypothetical protein